MLWVLIRIASARKTDENYNNPNNYPSIIINYLFVCSTEG